LLALPPHLWRDCDAEVGLDAVYPGSLPRPGNIDEYAAWVKDQLWMSRRAHSCGPYGTSRGAYASPAVRQRRFAIDLASEAINLGGIATGPVKTLIDGMWPILGGRPGAPDDGRITALVVRKGIRDLNGTASVKVAGLASQ
jgi:hypothetical protein